MMQHIRTQSLALMMREKKGCSVPGRISRQNLFYRKKYACEMWACEYSSRVLWQNTPGIPSTPATRLTSNFFAATFFLLAAAADAFLFLMSSHCFWVSPSGMYPADTAVDDGRATVRRAAGTATVDAPRQRQRHRTNERGKDINKGKGIMRGRNAHREK